MNNEEKKAVECLKKQYKQSAEKKDATLTIYLVKVKRILELIDKQQEEIETWKETENDYEHELARKEEEIEELKKDKKALVDNYSKVLGEFIPKDKIRAKIREFEQIRNIIANEENQNLNYDMKRNDYCVEMLKDLLEEN